MTSSKNEERFFFDQLKKEHIVLEYGSGESTLQISAKVNRVVSVEHQGKWYNYLNRRQPWYRLFRKILPNNVELLLKIPNSPYKEGGDDGTYEEFKDYVECPIPYGPFDVILIDGRARVACASIIKKLGNQNTIVFVHDFMRKEYQEVFEYLELIDNCETMFMFKIKY